MSTMKGGTVERESSSSGSGPPVFLGGLGLCWMTSIWALRVSRVREASCLGGAGSSSVFSSSSRIGSSTIEETCSGIGESSAGVFGDSYTLGVVFFGVYIFRGELGFLGVYIFSGELAFLGVSNFFGVVNFLTEDSGVGSLWGVSTLSGGVSSLGGNASTEVLSTDQDLTSRESFFNTGLFGMGFGSNFFSSDFLGFLSPFFGICSGD